MDEVRNPFAPGAGSPPPELAGRDSILSNADVAIQRVLAGRHAQSQILLGLRGTGKTVLLNKIEQIAEKYFHLTSFIEAPESEKLAELLYPKISQVLRKVSIIVAAKSKAISAMQALKGFASAFQIEVGDVSLSVNAEAGIADSGILEYDLSDLFVRVGEAVKAAGKGWTLLIDEVQYLSKEELSALIVAVHKVNQRQLPVLFFGAGLPQIAALSGDAKSYAERLFNYPPVGPLTDEAGSSAVQQPIIAEGETIDPVAVREIIRQTEGYPYFLQEWGFQSWNVAVQSPITLNDVTNASKAALQRLDEGFFRVRFDRLTAKEQEYVNAMARLGKGPYRSSDVADNLGENTTSLGPRRAKIIRKGMIYSPSYGDIAFTVPMFEEYLKRRS
ncbi:MAG: AAA family ATPase [Rhodobacteraceae bacterium]|nr:MAG: AAA family ATPase [Paracoccaceae bacterium]